MHWKDVEVKSRILGRGLKKTKKILPRHLFFGFEPGTFQLQTRRPDTLAFFVVVLVLTGNWSTNMYNQLQV